MMDHISWTDYLLGVLLCTAVYYVWVGLRFYRKELWTLLRFKQHQALQATPIPVTDAVMGAVAEEPERLINDNDIQFGEPEADATGEDNGLKRNEALGPADLMEEMGALIKVIAETAEPKENFLILYRLLTEKYETVLDPATREAIVQRLLEPGNGFAFSISSEDLQKTWNETVNK